MDISNFKPYKLVTGTEDNDSIASTGQTSTIQARGGNDSIDNWGMNVIIDDGAGNDTLWNDVSGAPSAGKKVSLNGGAGNDVFSNDGEGSTLLGGDGNDSIKNFGANSKIDGGKGNDSIWNDGNNVLFTYTAGDGNDLITGFDENSTLNIVKAEFTSATSGNDVIVTVGTDKITLEGVASLANPNVVSGTHATFTIKDSKVICDTDVPDDVIKDAYQFNAENSLLTINDKLKDYTVQIKADTAAKVNWHYGSASLSSDSTLEYRIADGEKNVNLRSKNYSDKITFNENATFNYGRIQAEVQENCTVSTKDSTRISFENNSSASVTTPRGYQVDVVESNITVNDTPINGRSGAGTVTLEKRGMSFNGYGVQLADLEVAKESYFGKLAPMTVDYNSSEESYTVYNTACVKTLSGDFTKLKFDFKTGTQGSASSDDKYAYYKVNDVAILTTKDGENTSVVEVNDRIFKVDDKELNAEKIGRIILDDKITFSGTEIDYDGLITTYAQNKPVIYSADGNEITISDAATVTVGENTKTFKCEAGSYTINGRSFETTTDLTFTAGTSEIKIPLNDAKTEIFFGGVKVSGTSGELVFDTVNDKISIPTGATLNIASSEETKLNLAAGEFTINGNKISSDRALEITADKDNIKVPLSENAVTINGAKITGSDSAQIDIAKTISLPDGALVQNVTENLFMLTAKNSSVTFGDANKKVQLTEDGTAYIGYLKENGIGVGFNALLFEQVEIQGSDAWTVETSGTSGIDKITGIKSGATITTSTEYVDAGDLRFEVETDGAGEFTICGEKFTATDKDTYVVRGNSNGEIKASTLADEFKDDDSEAAGKTYQFDAAGDYTVNGITFHASENSKAQTITRGVQFDLSSGKFKYDGLTLDGTGSAQINRYNASLISLTDGAKVTGSDESKYQNRQFEINGAVELIGKKFETNQPTRCALINIKETMEGIAAPLIGFVVDDKYVAIQNDCYDSVKVVDKKISSIEGVKASAKISGNGLANASIVATESGEFSVQGKTYKISGDSDGVTFVTDSHGNISEINGLAGSVEGNFENEVSVNGKAIQITGASSIRVTSDGESITEISNVSGDSDGTYRKDVRVYELGGAEKLTTSADGTIIFNGNKFETSAGKTFTLDSSGNISGLDKVQASNVSANVLETEPAAENLATINLSTTDGLEQVFGDFSEGITVNGVLVEVTDSTNFVVKNDDENIYIETTAPDTFTINGKTFKTQADKTIFKLDKDGNVSEIVTDKFYLYPDENSYLIEGDFNEEIIFNGKKFCVTGTNNTSIFIGDETLIGIELARNSVEVVESGGATEIAVSGGGEITIGGKTFSTEDGFAGVLVADSAGNVNSADNFIGTLSGKLGGVKLSGITITTEDDFSATSDGEKITAIENLQNGSLTSDNLDAITINGELISLDDLEETTLEVSDGEVKLDDTDDTDDKSAWQKLIEENPDAIIVENTSLEADSFAIVEETAKKISITASKGNDTIYTAGKNVDINLKAGGATEIYAAQGRATIENYNAKTGAAFLTGNENIAEAIAENSIAYDDSRLAVNSATVTFAEDADSRIINFVDTEGELQKVGFVSDDSKLDASKETGSLILVGASNSTIAGGKGRNQIQLDENSDSTILLNGRSTIDNFNATFDGGDKISVDATNNDFNFDGENLSVKSGSARGLLQSISSDGGAAKILTLINGKETKAAIAQAGEVISAGEDLADAYYGKKSGVDFSAYDDSLTIDLSENFHGINQVTVGGGLNTLISSSANETLTGSDGTTEYVFDKNCGRDIIQNFNFDEDKINVGTNAVTDVRINSAGGVRMEIGYVGSVTLDDAQGKNFKINEFTALVDKNLTYDAAANYFVATAQNASLTVTESAEIWLDGSHGKTFVGDIRTLDASTAQGNTSLAGNDLDNTICAGSGNASLWGGNGGDDLLIGGKAHNLFFYTNGNGSDTITGAHDGDAVVLSNVTLDQIASTNITADSVSINFIDGGSLYVEGKSDVTYQLADRSSFSANHEQAVWMSK